jgi:Domain of unknown function (DUF5659)
VTDLPFTTSETDFAVYLIQSGFILLGINYEPRSNGRQRGIFIFSHDSHIEEYLIRFRNNQVSINLNDLEKFKEIKSGLLDRIMQGLP